MQIEKNLTFQIARSLKSSGVYSSSLLCRSDLLCRAREKEMNAYKGNGDIMKRNENLSKLALEYRSAFNLRVFFHHQCVCVPRAPALPLALLCLCWAAGLGRAVQRAVMPWIDLSLVQTIQNLKCCHSRSGEGGKKTHMHPPYSKRSRRQQQYCPQTALKGTLCLVAHPRTLLPILCPFGPAQN